MLTTNRGNIKLILIFGIVGIIAIIGAVGATLYFTGFFKGKGSTESVESGHSQKDPPIYLGISPAFTVNVIDKNQIRFMQTSITVMAREQSVMDAITDNIVAIQNDIREVLSGQPYSDIIVSTGINQLRLAAKDAVNAILKAHNQHLIEDLYFTSIVVQ